ncbi:hypothetical protein DY000_02011626 [Brassica cretica]|uniref:Secreted protein n=1 Tax=Brassica cretica TaxID=69181 RepID=A0ABQ7D530_BRACR|nr:hypothetical protein DY000_02011626 [Brassica cretica]
MVETLLSSGGRCLEPVPEALLVSFLVFALRSSALSLRYALGSDKGISQRPPAPLERFADPMINSFPEATARWVNGVSRWSQLLGFRAKSIFIARSGLLTEASGEVSCCGGEKWQGVGVEVVPRRLRSVGGYILRQRVHRRFVYSVARAGMYVVLWWRVVSDFGM